MRESYLGMNGLGIAFVARMTDQEWSLATRHPAYYVSSLTTHPDYRGHGIGKELMFRVCRDADMEGAILTLEFDPIESMDRERLRWWYEKLGFATLASKGLTTPSGRPIMIRYPLDPRRPSSPPPALELTPPPES